MPEANNTQLTEDTISIVLPCLNEEETLEPTIKKALKGIQLLKMKGEVIVVDNGSTDRSVEIAKKAGARVVHEKEKGYGSALMRGFKEDSGTLFAMGDADDTYDFRELPVLFEKLQSKNLDLVSGNRLRGKITPDAMPFIHRYLGVPALTLLLNLFFWTGVWDGHCGMRLFTKEAYQKMSLNQPGMEFASEMLIRARLQGLRMAEVPISYGARHNKSYSKLNTFRDGFRHLWLILRFALGDEV